MVIPLYFNGAQSIFVGLVDKWRSSDILIGCLPKEIRCSEFMLSDVLISVNKIGKILVKCSPIKILHCYPSSSMYTHLAY